MSFNDVDPDRYSDLSLDDLATACGAPDLPPNKVAAAVKGEISSQSERPVAPKTLIPPPFRGFTEADLNAAKLHPRCIVLNQLYADLALVAAAGGVGKTTTELYEAICIAIGRDLWGCKVINPGKTLFITAEDSSDLLAARLREIMDAMGLTPDERRIARESIAVWDVSGEMIRLAQLDKSGNIELTDLADSIVTAYQGDNLVQVVFDPVISFGPGERVINDGEQAIVTACRRIIRGLNCCVRLIHHTGKANARAGAIDQYASRGGTALPDGCRMVTILSSVRDTTQTPPDGFALAPGDSGFVMARAKLSYAPPQPNIWIRRRGFTFEFWTEEHRSADEIIASDASKVEAFIKEELLHGRKYTGRALEAVGAIKIPRQRLRTALALLDTSGRIIERDLPAGERRGKRKTYLSATFTSPPDYCADPPGAIDPPDPSDPIPDPTPKDYCAIAPPYREEENGAIDAASPLHVFLNAPTYPGAIAAQWRNSQNGTIRCLDCTFFKTNDNGATGACKCVTCSERRKGPSLIGDRLKECSHFNGKAGRMEEGFQHGC